MKNDQPSREFNLFNAKILQGVIRQMQLEKDYIILNKYSTDTNPTYDVENAYKRNKELMGISMEADPLLDRHKLASCICAAIMEVRPLGLRRDNQVITTSALNASLAILASLKVLKKFMEYKLKAINCDNIQNSLEVILPDVDENIQETKPYALTFQNALVNAFKPCKKTNDSCTNFDLWAYSKIFYHIEVYNWNKFYNQKYDIKAAELTPDN